VSGVSDDRKQLTPTQQAILYKKGANPNWQNTEIANAVGCSDSHVSDTLNRWSPDEMDEDGTVPGQSTISLGSLIFGSVEDVDRDSPAPFSVGFGVVAIGIGLWVWWILVLMNPGEFSETIGNAVMFTSLFWLLVFPVGVFLDSWVLHRVDAAWRPNRIVWPSIAFFVPVIGASMYALYRLSRA
jgi:hypothetical protein